ncbi:MAG: hypothetical protein QOF58_3878 [Pseudonocardiales bacterium]|jgi:hypothetical protein|nr:hypothetical protein [Pseudonocardiales bacterium]
MSAHKEETANQLDKDAIRLGTILLGETCVSPFSV